MIKSKYLYNLTAEYDSTESELIITTYNFNTKKIARDFKFDSYVHQAEDYVTNQLKLRIVGYTYLGSDDTVTFLFEPPSE